MKHYRFAVKGLPVPKGSTKAFVIRGGPRKGQAVVTSASNTKDWEKVIKFQVQDFPVAPLEGPVGLYLTFYLPRPQSAPRRVQLPAKKPDLDKLARACLDALTGIIYRDDSQVVELYCRKRFAREFNGVTGIVVDKEPRFL